jgi:hypothetical protein
MPDLSDIQRDLLALAGDLKRLEAEYTMFFSGRLRRPPWETRARVQAVIKRWSGLQITPTGDRFRFEMLQSRFQALADLWDRALRAREEGRPGPFASGVEKPALPATGASTVAHVAAFTDPIREIDKLHVLYDTLMDARRRAGEAVVPFHSFAALVSSQVTKLQDEGSPEVAFRVAVTDGKVNLTVRGLKGAKA